MLLVSSVPVGLAASPRLDHYNLTAASDSIAVDATTTITAQGIDQNGNAIAGTPTSWTTTCGTLTGSGASVTFRAPTTTGSCTVTASSGSGGNAASGSKAIGVVAGPVTTITVTGPASVAVGQQGAFTATGKDQFNNTVTMSPSWSSGCGGSFSSSTFTAPTTPVASCIITAASGGVSGTKTISVPVGPLAAIVLTPSSATLVVGGTQTFAAAGQDAYQNAVAITPTWSTSCGSVTSGGAFTAPTAPASCTVTATSGSVSRGATVTVNAGALQSIAISAANYALTAGDTRAFTATGADSYGNSVTPDPVWTTTCGSITTSGVLTGTIAGTCSVTGTQRSTTISNSKSVTIAAGPLAALAITPNPTTMTAGSSAVFGARKVDAYGNDVGSAPNSVWTTTCSGSTITNAPPIPDSSAQITVTNAGTCTLTATAAGGKTGSATINVGPGPAASITVSPATPSVRAGATQAFTASGTDAYGNAISSISATWGSSCGSFSGATFTAPTSVGTCSITASSGSASGSTTATIVAGPLTRIVVSGPASLAAGTAGTYSLAGFDQYNNAVTLANSSMSYTAPTTAGSATVSYTQSGITGSQTISVVAGPLARLVVSGVDSMVVGTSATFTLAGFDAYSNAVTLGSSSFSATAPTTAGAFDVSHTIDSVTGTKRVTALAGAVSTITITGPDSLVAGTSGAFSAAGRDQYGNPQTLSTTSFSFTAPTVAGSASACHTENGVSGCKTITIVAAALSRIVVSGPSSLVAAASGTYALSGFDQYSNAVTLAQSSMSYTAPTTAGPATVSYAQNGVTGTQAITVLAGPLARIDVAGLDTVVAGTTSSYALSGFDQYGNAVTLAASTLQYTAPGIIPASVQVCYEEKGIRTCLPITIVPDVLAQLVLAGPLDPVAGTTAQYALTGFDQYGNEITIDDIATVDVPTAAGATTISVVYEGITGEIDVVVLHAALSRIDATGPTDIEVGTSATFTLAGFDAFDNPVALSTDSHTLDAPTGAGSYVAEFTIDGIPIELALTLLPGPLATIEIGAPESGLRAGATVTFSVTGYDTYGNEVELDEPTFSLTLPKTAGASDVCHAVGEVDVCLAIQILAASLARIAIDGPTTLAAGSSATYDLAGFDAFDNPVTLAQSSLAYPAAIRPGPATVSYTQQGVTGALVIAIVPAALHAITLTGAATLVAGTTATYALSGADVYGNVVELDSTSYSFDVPSTVGSAQVCYTESDVTACIPVVVIPAALADLTATCDEEIVAGATVTCALAGFDEFGNDVEIVPATRTFTAPERAGASSVEFNEGGVTLTFDFNVEPAPLESIVVSGVSSMTVGTTAIFTATGYDAFENGIALAGTPFTVPAPERAGEFTVSFSVGEITGEQSVTATAGPVATIVVSGPATLDAGATDTYALSATDAFGNSQTLARSSMPFTAPTAVGSVNACYTEGGATGCALVAVVAGPLASITLFGPATLDAGDLASYTLAGADRYLNPVDLPDATVDFAAPTEAGPASVSYTHGGVTGTLPVSIVAGPLTSITVSGNPTIRAGATGVYALAGADQYGNAVTLAQSTIDYTAPQIIPESAEVCYSEDGIPACMPITIIPDVLAQITLAGPLEPVAGTTVEYTLTGLDRYGNEIAIDYVVTIHVPTKARPAMFRVIYQDIAGTIGVDVQPAPLSRIDATGPTNVEVGTSATFTLAGFDAFGNPVELSVDSYTLQVPTNAGAYTAEFTIDDISVERSLSLLPGSLTTLEIGGPDGDLVAGATITYSITGYDVYGNDVGLDERTFSFNVPRTAGDFEVCRTVDEIDACIPIHVVAAALARIVVDGPTTLPAGASASYALTGADQYGNLIALPDATVAFTARTTVGSATVSYTHGGVTGTFPVSIVAGPLTRISVSGSPTLAVGATALYALAGVDQYGNAVTLAESSIEYVAATTPGTDTVSYTQSGITGAMDVQIVPGPIALLVLDGPGTMVAGTTASGEISGFDEFGNELSAWRLPHLLTASTTAGPQTFTTSAPSAGGGILVATHAVTVVPGPIASFEIANGDITRSADDVAPIELFLSAADEFGNRIAVPATHAQWSSGEEADGMLSPSTVPGTYELTATYDGHSASVRVTTTVGALALVTLTPSSVRLALGGTVAPVPGFFDAHGNSVPTPVLSWNVGNATILAFDPVQGRATGLALGVTELTLRVGDFNAVSRVEVLRPEDAVTSLNLNIPMPELPAGESFVFTIVAVDDGGNPIAGLRPNFTVVEPIHGSITSEGVFTGDQAGVTDVIAQVGHFSATATVVVIPGALAQIRVIPDSASLALGGSIQLSAVGMDARRNVIPGVPMTWSVVDPTKGGITADGLYTAGSIVGASRVRATAGTIFREAPVYQYVPTVATTGTITTIDAVAVTATVADVTTTTHVVGVAAVEAGSEIQLTITDEDSAQSGVSDASVRLERAATNVTIMFEVQPASSIVLPEEVDRALFEASEGQAPALFITVTATEDGARLSSDRLNALLERIEIRFAVAESYFVINGLDPAQVYLTEWSDGRLVRNDISATLLAPDPVNGNYEYVAILDQFSAFAFAARPLAVGVLPPVKGPTAMSPQFISPLGRILISGPATVVAGSTATYALTGVAADGSPRILAQSQLTTTFTQAGDAVVRYGERGVEGAMRVKVVPGAVRSLGADQATRIYAGANGGFRLVGADAHGNALDLGWQRIEFTRAGLQTITIVKDGVQTTIEVDVIADFLARIAIEGPDTIPAGGEATYTLTGYDGHDNPIELADQTITVQGPRKAGPVEIFYEVGSIRGAKTVEVLAGALARIDVIGVEVMRENMTETFRLTGYDEFDNLVPLAREAIEFQAEPGSHDTHVCYAEGSISGCRTVVVEVPVVLQNVVGESVGSASASAFGFILTMLGLVLCVIGAAAVIGVRKRRK